MGSNHGFVLHGSADQDVKTVSLSPERSGTHAIWPQQRTGGRYV